MAHLIVRQGTTYERLPDEGANSEGEDTSFRHDGTRKPDTAFSTESATAFDSKKQALTILWKQTLRWLTTAAFLFAFLATLRIYHGMGNVNSAQKNICNGIITALLLLQGLNFFEAFKELAKVLRWRILAQGKHSVREVDLILGLEGLTNVIVLGWESIRKPLIPVFCFSWIMLNLLAQTSVALMSQTYSFEDGRDSNGTYITSGIVDVTNLTCYFHANASAAPFCPSDPNFGPANVQGIAHTYGSSTASFDCGPYNDTSDILNSKYAYPYFCRRTKEKQEFAYRFSEYNPSDVQNAYGHLTNRIFTASAGQCFEHHQVAPSVLTNNLDGVELAMNYTYTNGSNSGSIVIPLAAVAPKSTTYHYRGTNVPQHANKYSCGPRCIWMWAHNNTIGQDDTTFYECPITISLVSNANSSSVLEISDDMARLAAAAIGLQGRFTVQKGRKIWTQYQFYPFGSPFEIHYHSTDEVGAKMAEFAMISLATMINRNPPIQTNGSLPQLGTRLGVDWAYAGALSAWILGTQAAIFAVVIRTAQVVIVKDDSELSTARLLRPLVEGTGFSGTLLTGKEMSRLLERYHKDGLVYGPREVKGSNEHSLEIGEDISPLGRWSKKRHPKGKYR